MGPVPLRGRGEGRGSHTQRDPLTARGSMGMGRDPQGMGGSEGNTASIFPSHSAPGKSAEVPGLILCHPRPPLAMWVLETWEGVGEEN